MIGSLTLLAALSSREIFLGQIPAGQVSGAGGSASRGHVIVGARSVSISPDGTKLAFSYRGDVWVAPSAGGRATPLTDNVEMEDNPVWSPDGKWLAFATDRNGNWDIYAVPVEGGRPARLTWFSGGESPVSWTPDGKEIVYTAVYDKGYPGVYALNVESLRLREVTLDYHRIAYPVVSPDGKSVAYLRKQMFPWTRPRYQGSGAAQLWTVGMESGERRLVRSTGFQHLWPAWNPDGQSLLVVTVTDLTPSSRRIDERPVVPFADSAERTPNVYRVGLNGRAQRLTNFVGGSGARFLSVARTGLAAFEREGDVYTMSPGGQPTKLDLTASVDDKGVVEERLTLTSGAEDATLSPDGKTVVLQLRRELWSVPVTRGRGPNGADARQLTKYAGTDNQPVYAPDGKSVFFTSDRGGALSLYRLDLETGEAVLAHETKENVSGLALSPDKTLVSYWVSGRDGGLFTLPVEGGTPTRVIDRAWGGQYAWSPDQRYVAYVRTLPNSGFKPWENGSNIWVFDTQTKTEANVTQLNVLHSSPAWSADGKYLYFTSNRAGGGLFAIPATREEARSTELELKYTKPTETPKVEFELAGAAQRIRRLYAGPVSGGIRFDKEKGDIYFVNAGDIWRVGYDGEGARSVVSGGGVSRFDFSGDGNSLFYLRAGGVFLTNIRQPNLPTSQVEYRADWTRDILAERRAAFQEFYSVYNQTFYDEFFHRRDWRAIRDRHERLLDSVGHRNEFATVLNMMAGELEASHAEVGAAPGGNPSQSTAHLGFTIDFSYGGPALRVKDVPANTPGSFAKTRIKPGEFVVAINGKPVRADQHLWRLLNEEGNRDITLSVNERPTPSGARDVRYRAPSGGAFRAVLTDNLEKQRRAYVERTSGGRLTYIHIAGMGGGNLTTFNQEMWAYVQGKEGVVIDVRENGGGNIADILLDVLERRLHMRYQWRGEQEEIPGPGQVWGRPTVVMHAETSFSNAEMFPAAMKSLGLATLVGMQTPGYVIYTGGSRLVDGTSIRIPGGGVYRVDGSPLENNGQKPDIEVDLTPEDFFAGRDPQLTKAVEHLMRQLPRG